MSGLAGRVIAHNHEDNTSSYPRAEDSGLPVGTGWEGNTACVSIEFQSMQKFTHTKQVKVAVCLYVLPTDC